MKKSSSEDHGNELLRDQNWLRWRDDILDKGLEYGEAGRAVRLRANPNFRMPQLTDERHIVTGEVMSKEVAMNKIKEIADQLLADDDENELSNAGHISVRTCLRFSGIVRGGSHSRTYRSS